MASSVGGEAANIPCVLGSALEAALGSLVSAYVAAAACGISATELGDRLTYEATLLRAPPRLAHGCLVLPTSPSLRVAIDEAQPQCYRLNWEGTCAAAVEAGDAGAAISRRRRAGRAAVGQRRCRGDAGHSLWAASNG